MAYVPETNEIGLRIPRAIMSRTIYKYYKNGKEVDKKTISNEIMNNEAYKNKQTEIKNLQQQIDNLNKQKGILLNDLTNIRREYLKRNGYSLFREHYKAGKLKNKVQII